MKQFNPTIIKEDFNPKTGESYVIINYLDADFYGKAKCHPEDKEYMGEFTGKSYAYERACIKAMKYELALEKTKCEECRKFVKSCMSYKNFDKTSGTAKAMFRQLNIRIKEVNKIIDAINAKEMKLITREKAQRVFNKKHKMKKDSNKD